MIPELVIVALDFYRDPRRFAHLTDPRQPLPAGISDLLAAPANVLSDDHIEETARTLNASVDECREMVPFFIKQALLDAGGDYYRTLGLRRSADRNQVKQHYHYGRGMSQVIRRYGRSEEKGSGQERPWTDLLRPNSAILADPTPGGIARRGAIAVGRVRGLIGRT